MKYFARPIGIIAIAMAGFCLAATSADTSLPDSTMARAAMSKHAQAMKEAQFAYNKAVSDADKAYVIDLTHSLDDSMSKHNVNDVEKIHKLVEQAKKASPPDVSEWVAGTVWLYKGGDVEIKYLPGGVAACSAWPAKGKWQSINENTILQIEPGDNRQYITFDSQHEHALWVNISGGSVSYSVRK